MMRRRLALCASFIGAFGIALSAAAAPPPPSFTLAQAERGHLAFIEQCGECHGGELGGQIGPALAGPDSKVQWEPGQYVFGYMVAHMPHGNPGSLPIDEYVSIMAFLYQRHHHAPGRRALDASAAKSDKALMGW